MTKGILLLSGSLLAGIAAHGANRAGIQPGLTLKDAYRDASSSGRR
jgi:hypothetical protein